MDWNMKEAAAYYIRQGGPSDQNAIIGFLREAQQAHGGRIPQGLVTSMAEVLGTKAGVLLALIRRIPSLKLEDTHILELCAGPNCPKRADLAGFVEREYGKKPGKFTVKYVPCLRRCGQGPNLRWDGKLYNRADEALIRKLVEGK